MADVAFFLLGLASKPGGQVARLASPKILLLLNLIIRLVAFQSGMVALLEPGLEKPVCRHERTWQCGDSAGFCRPGMVWPACCQHLLGSLHWKCLVFLPFRDSEVHEEPGGKLPAAHSKIKAGAKAKAPDSTAACAPRTIQFLLPCAKFPVPKDVPETPSLSGRESLLQNEAGAWRVRGLKKKKKRRLFTLFWSYPQQMPQGLKLEGRI